MGLGLVLLFIITLLLIGTLPGWSHGASWDPRPSLGFGLLAFMTVVLVLTGRL
jgi:hypothetical protein